MSLKNFVLELSIIYCAAALYVSDNSSKILSRRKRYVIFPEGSSFQLVYCLTMPTFGQGQIFTIGLTAALAWELPHEPIHFGKKESASERIDVIKTDEKSPISISAVTPYYRPWSENGWAMYYKQNQYRAENNVIKHRRKSLFIEPSFYEKENDLPAYVDHGKYYEHYEAHRRTRRTLFDKIEKFFAAQKKDGRACLLKALCEVNRTQKGKGTFVQEIIKAIFTWRPDDENLYEEDDDYNRAVHKNINCTEIYSGCSHTIWDVFF